MVETKTKVGLTDEEIENISDNIACSFIGSVAESGLEPDPIIKRAIAKAQLKKVVEWGNDLCLEHANKQVINVYKRECPECWHALLEEMK